MEIKITLDEEFIKSEEFVEAVARAIYIKNEPKVDQVIDRVNKQFRAKKDEGLKKLQTDLSEIDKGVLAWEIYSGYGQNIINEVSKKLVTELKNNDGFVKAVALEALKTR